MVIAPRSKGESSWHMKEWPHEEPFSFFLAFGFSRRLWAEVQAWQISRVTINVKQNLLEKAVDCFIASTLSHDKIKGMAPDGNVGAWTI